LEGGNPNEEKDLLLAKGKKKGGVIKGKRLWCRGEDMSLAARAKGKTVRRRRKKARA